MTLSPDSYGTVAGAAAYLINMCPRAAIDDSSALN